MTALSYLVAKESPPSLLLPVFLSWRLARDTGFRTVTEEEGQAVSVLGRAYTWQKFAGI